jgi:hypothetical protein
MTKPSDRAYLSIISAVDNEKLNNLFEQIPNELDYILIIGTDLETNTKHKFYKNKTNLFLATGDGGIFMLDSGKFIPSTIITEDPLYGLRANNLKGIYYIPKGRKDIIDAQNKLFQEYLNLSGKIREMNMTDGNINKYKLVKLLDDFMQNPNVSKLDLLAQLENSSNRYKQQFTPPNTTLHLELEKMVEIKKSTEIKKTTNKYLKYKQKYLALKSLLE